MVAPINWWKEVQLLRLMRRVLPEPKRGASLRRMVELDEEMEQRHPGWMNGRDG